MTASCSNPYKYLPEQKGIQRSALAYKLRYDRMLYRCVVNGHFLFRNFHLSGLLLVKQIDTQTRVVFSNEMGLSFFDFSWNIRDSFAVNQVIPQLNRTAVLRLLQKDFEMLLMKNLKAATEKVCNGRGDTRYHRFTMDRGFVYYGVTHDSLETIENVGRGKVVSMALSGQQSNISMPSHISIVHHKAHFKIDLEKIEQHVNE